MSSLAKQLTFRIMAVVLVMMAAITGCVYFTVRAYMLTEAQERYEGALLRDHEEFRRRLSDVMVAVKNNIHNIEQDIDEPEKITAHLERILRANPTILTCGVQYEPDYFPGKPRCLELFASHDSTGTIHQGKIENDNNIYIDRSWFRKCLAQDTADWSEVYFEHGLIPHVSDRRQVTTYYMPVHDKQGRPVALFGSDLPLKFLRIEMMNDLQALNEKHEKGNKHHAFNFVINHKGTYLIHPDKRRILNDNFFQESRLTTNTIDDHIVASMRNGEKGSAMVEIDGIPSWIYYRNVKHMDWIIGIVVPEETIFHNARMLNTIILAVILLALLAIYFFCRRTIKDTTTPVTAHQAVIDRELKIAHNIQMAMLPQMPLKSLDGTSEANASAVDLFASLTPAREVGGDLYDFMLRDNRLFFCIGDVSGKGIPAALVMAVTRSLFHSISSAETDPKRIIWRINKAICEGNETGMFVTMFVGVIDLTTGQLEYCNAGHEPPLLSGKPLPVKRNLPVGALAEWNFEGQQTQLHIGDLLFFFTDGLSEAKNQDDQRLGRRHVLQIASEHTSDTARQLVELMEEEVHRHAANAEQSDDITLLAIKWNYDPSSIINDTLTMQASVDNMAFVQPYIENIAHQAGLSEKETKRLRLAVEEAVINVINYGQATVINLQASVADHQLTLTIEDDGLPFDPTQGSATDLDTPPDQRPPGGMGIILLQTMTDDLNYHRTAEHNVLTLIKKIN